MKGGDGRGEPSRRRTGRQTRAAQLASCVCVVSGKGIGYRTTFYLSNSFISDKGQDRARSWIAALEA
jgi:hypothetical protein